MKKILFLLLTVFMFSCFLTDSQKLCKNKWILTFYWKKDEKNNKTLAQKGYDYEKMENRYILEFTETPEDMRKGNFKTYYNNKIINGKWQLNEYLENSKYISLKSNIFNGEYMYSMENNEITLISMPSMLYFYKTLKNFEKRNDDPMESWTFNKYEDK